MLLFLPPILIIKMNNYMKNKWCFLSFFLLFSALVSAQNNIVEEEVLALTTIESRSFVFHFEYNENGLVISETRNAFENEYLNYKYEYEYDGNGNLSTLYMQDVNKKHLEENDYNDNNQIVEKRIHEDYGSGFQFTVKQIYIYHGVLLDSIVFYVGVNLRKDKKQEFVYNKDEQLIQIKQYAWVPEQWLPDEIFDFEYDDFGLPLFYANEVNNGDGFWKQWRYSFVYNDNRELTERTYHIGTGMDWNSRPSEKYLFFYEDLKDDEMLLFPNIYQFDNIDFNWFQSEKKIVKDSLWIADCSFDLHFVESASYRYEPITIGSGGEVGVVETQCIASLQVFPNPTTGKLRIENGELRIENLSIFDVYGRRQKIEYRISDIGKSDINISHLQSGIYFIKIKTENQTITKKIIKL